MMFKRFRVYVSADSMRQPGRLTLLARLAFLVSLTLFGAACKQLSPEQRAQEQLAKAREYAKRGKVNEAIIEYRRAIQTDSKLAVLHYELGKLYVDREDYLSGAQQMNTAVQLDPSNREAHLALAGILLLAKNYPEAKEQADAVLLQHAGDPEALLVLARTARGMGKLEEARSATEEVLRSQPANADAWLVLAGLQFEAKDYQASEHSFRQSIQYDPTQLASTAAFTGLLLKQNRTSEAETLIRNYAARNPTSIAAEYLLAAFLIQQQRMAEAEPVFRNISQVGESDPRQRAALAGFYVSTQKFDLAEKELLSIVNKHPDDVGAHDALASLYMSTNRAPEADKIAASVLKSTPDNADALVLHGRFLIEQTRIDEAILDLQHATRADPQSIQAHYYLAIAQLQHKQATLAQAELESALELQSDFSPARILLAGIKLDAGEMKAGMSDLDRAIAAKPAILGPYITRSILRAQQGEASHAEKDLLPLLDQFPQATDRALTYRALAWAMFNRKKYDAARRFLQQSTQAQPDSPETFYLSGLTYIAENRPGAALSLIQSNLRNTPNWAEGYAVGGELAAIAGHKSEAETYFKKAVSLNPKLMPAWQALGLVLSAQSKYDAALDAFNEVLRLSPNSGGAYFNIAQVHDMHGDWNRAQEAYRKSLDLEPDNAVAKNNLAWSYAEHGGNIDVALRLAQEAHQAKPDDPEISDTMGWIYMKKNTLSEAIQAFKKSVSLVPTSPEYSYHLGMAYLRSGDTAKAKELLEATLHMEPSSPFAPEVRKMLVSLKN
jgi:tetratricopeptide (TPR) repeat protein